MSKEMPAGHISVTEAQRLSSYSRPQIYNLLRDRKIKAQKWRFGEMVVFLIDRESLLAYCEKRRRVVNEKTA